MIKDKLVENSCSKLIDTEKFQTIVSYNATKKTKPYIVRFSFIDISQWLLLALLNCVCLGFIFFSCNLIY